MKKPQGMRKWRLPYLAIERAPGQSIPLIALMIVALVGMVGMSVDVGNTYSEQRELTRSTDAAARVAMQSYIDGESDGNIARNIQASFRANGIEPVSWETTDLEYSQRRWRATYLDAKGRTIGNCEVGKCTSDPPGGVSYILVQTDGRVDTYFARVVGAESLPVNTDACVTKSPPLQGVFPMAVKSSAINTDIDPPTFDSFGGNAPSRFTVPDARRAVYSMQRLYLDTGNGLYNNNVGVGFLRWKKGYGTGDLPTMLAGTGNLEMGFEEVTPWPDTTIPPPRVNGQVVYPYQPGHQQQGDWVYGFQPDKVNLGSLATQFEQHMANRTQLILPIYQVAVPTTDDEAPAFYIVRYGKFYVAGYGQDPDRDNSSYVDLALHSLDPVVPAPCDNTSTRDSFGIVGYVRVNGIYGERERSTKPSGYSLVLDVSGSMSWNFAGLGSKDGRDYQCETYNPNLPWEFGPSSFGDCQGGPGAYWRERSDRRIYTARQSILNMMEKMDPEDRVRVIFFSSGIEAQSSTWYAPGDATLMDEVQRKAQYTRSGVGDPTYLTDGGTNGTQALRLVNTFITDANFPREPDGQNRELRRVVIYITDGVSRGLLDGSEPRRVECDYFDTSDAKQRAQLINTAWCFIGERNGQLLSISYMQKQSQQMHETMFRDGHDDFKLYVLAMGQADLVADGLGAVATTPSMLFKANKAEEVVGLLEQIRNDVQHGECALQRDYDVRSIEGEHAPDPDYVNPPLEDGAVGYAIITQNGVPIANVPDGAVPIVNSSDGLMFSLPPENGLTPGQYELRAYVWYNAGGKEGGTRLYDKITNPSNPSELVNSIQFTVAEPLGDTVRVPDAVNNVVLNMDSSYYEPPEKLCQ